MKGEHVRVQRTDDNRVHLQGLDTITLDDLKLDAEYESLDKMPQWLQNRVKLIQPLPVPPPHSEVTNIGFKITERVYWVRVSWDDV